MNPFYEIAKNLRDQGVDQGTIYEAFSSTWEDMDEEYQEVSHNFADALDCIVGYCGPHMKLFPDGLGWKELENE